MADPTEHEDHEGEAPKQNWRRALEERAETAEGRADSAEKRVAELERKIAMADAGLSGLSDRQVKALMATHEGEITAEALKASAAELGFGTATADSGESTPEATGALEPTLDPSLAAEASEIAALSSSPAQHASGKDVVRTQEAFDEKVRSFETEAELDAFLRQNLHLLPHGQ